MSDVGVNIVDLSLKYRGVREGFERVVKRPVNIIQIHRQKGEDDDSYVVRICDALEREQKRRYRNGFTNLKQLSPQDKDFLDGYNLAQKKKLVFGAGRDFDDALFDQDLTGGFKALRKLETYFKMGGDPSFHRDVFLLLKRMAVVGCPIKNPTPEDELAYKVFVCSAINILITNFPKGLGRVEAINNVLSAREKAGLLTPNFEPYRFVGMRFNFCNTKYSKSYAPPHDEIPDILYWADPIETLDFVLDLDRNSPLLTMVVRSVVDKIDRWYSFERTKDRQDDADDFISRRFAKMANPESGMSFAGFVRQKLLTAIENNHPQSEFLKSNLNKIEEVRARQEKELADRRKFTEQEIEFLLAEQQEREQKFQSGWGLRHDQHHPV